MRKVLTVQTIAAMTVMFLMEAPTDKPSGGDAKQEEAPKEGNAKEVDTADARMKDEYFGSTLHKESIAKAVEDKHIVLEHQKKTQKTRGKGSREISYEWDDIKFVDTDGVLAFVGGDETRLLTLLSDVASDMNQQMAWEVLFELSDEDRLVRQAAKRIARVLNITDEEAEPLVRKMIEDKAKEVAAASTK